MNLQPTGSAEALFLLSDLHFGRGDPADDFALRGSTSRLHRFLRVRERNGERIGLLGDIFELWECGWEEILSAHGETVEYLFSLADFCVVGNHDWDLLGRKVFGLEALPNLILDDHIWLEHGHGHDRMVGRFPRLARAICAVGGWAERVIHHDVDKWALGAATWLGGTGRYGGNLRYLDPVAYEARGRGCDVAVFGHTHRALSPGLGMYGWSVTIHNTGAWTGGRGDYVRIERDGEAGSH